MKVLYLHQHFTTRAGSTGTRSYEMARELIARGHSVHMICGSFEVANSGLTEEFVKGRRSGMVDGIHITEFHIPYSNSDSLISRTKAFLGFALKTTLVALKEPYDLIFATSTPLTAGIPAIVARHLRRKAFVFEVRDLWPELPKAMGVVTNPVILKALSVLEWVSYRSAKACIGLSPGIVEGIKARSKEGASVALIPNGCDVDLFLEPDAAKYDRQNKAEQPFTAIFSGAHGRANGLDAVLDAAAQLKKMGRTDIRLLFIGEGGLKPGLVKRAEEEGLSNCEFRSVIPKTELSTLLSQVDVGLMCLANVPAFYYGTSPNKFFDYLAAGLPVLNNYPGWVASIVEEDKVGKVVAPESAEAFANALCQMADDPAMLKEMSENARRCAATRFNRKELATQFVDFLETVV